MGFKGWDGFSISSGPRFPPFVIPAKAGIHFDLRQVTERKAESEWIPAFAGMTRVVGFRHFLKFESAHRHLDKAPTDLTTKCHDTWAKLRAPVTRGMDGTAHQQRYCPCGFSIAR